MIFSVVLRLVRISENREYQCHLLEFLQQTWLDVKKQSSFGEGRSSSGRMEDDAPQGLYYLSAQVYAY